MTDRLLVFATLGISYGLALPHSDGQSLYSRQGATTGVTPPDGSNQDSFSMQVWLPVVIIGILGLVLVVSICHKRARRNASSTAPEDRNNPTQQTQQTANGTTPGRTRRSRRPRRTPSQISTASLPAYMKEPGDEELVVYRAVSDMEDAHLMAPSMVSRDDDPSPGHSRNTSFSYQPMPFPSNDTPLLSIIRPDYAPSSSFDSTSTLRQSTDRRSEIDSIDTSSTSGVVPSSPEDTDLRGEAPPYSEVNHNAYPPSPPAPSASILNNSRPSSPASRGSGLRNFFGAFSPRASVDMSIRSVTRTHSRAGSSFSIDPPLPLPDPSHSREISPFRFSHRSTNSSGSTNISSALRPPSRRSNNNSPGSQHMRSPSQISLQSISAPLTHTLVRTEFTLPKAGLTPEQLKAISSRDSLGKFGIPYGPDAIAYAASTSPNNLPPPPDFTTSSPSPLRGEVFPGRSLSPELESMTMTDDVGPSQRPAVPDRTSQNAEDVPKYSAQITTAATDAAADGPRRRSPDSNPPSAFRSGTALRPESRNAFSTYLRAVESMGIDAPTTPEPDPGPSTPHVSETQLQRVHAQEGTDETVVRGRQAAAAAASSSTATIVAPR